MNTLLFTLEYPPFYGGVANYYGNLVKYWPQPDRIFVLNNNDGHLINKSWPVLRWLPAIRRLRQSIKNNQIEHVVAGQILPLGLIALIYHKYYGLKYTVILHGADFSFAATKSWRKKIITRMILNRAQSIICTNAYTANLVISFLGHKYKIVVANPGVDSQIAPSEQFVKQLKQKYNLENKIILLSVGRLIKRKGFDKVIEAVPKVIKQIPNLIYVIIGDGEEQENLKFKILNFKLKDNVLIINNAADQEREAWYGICDIFIMPSRNIKGDFEGFGIVYLEANLAGKPVIAGPSGGVGDAVIDGLNGLLVDPVNINDISEKIVKLALNPELRQKLGRQGKTRAIKEFNWGKQVQKIYKSIM